MKSFQEQQIYNLGQTLDALMTADIHSRGIIKPIYDAMFQRVGEPLSTFAATSLLKAMKECSKPVVFIGTGFLVKPTLHAETDGPIAAALLARAISMLGGAPVIISQQESMCVLEPACKAAEIIPFYDLDKAISTPHAVGLVVMPPCSHAAEAEELCQKLMAYSPVGMVSIELPGKAANGAYHSALGYELKNWPGPIDDLMEMVGVAGGCTIGIGDAGNEAGMGYVEHALDTIIPYGEVVGVANGCTAPIIASISEYGTYALMAAMEFISGKNILQSTELEERVLKAAVYAGSLDGCTGKPITAIDMVDLKYICAYLEMLHCTLITTNNFIPTRPYNIDFCRGVDIGAPGAYSGGHG